MKNQRVLLDTNVVISAILLKGAVSGLHTLWKQEVFTIVASKEIMDEYLRVLAYPKFELTETEIKTIIHQELLPYIEPVTVTENPNCICKDKNDDKFLICAETSQADVIVSGDVHLLSLKKYKNCPIITAEMFLKNLSSG